MKQAQVADAVLEFEFRGAGQPVLLIHGTALADSFLPLVQQPALLRNNLLIRYHRRGFGGSSRIGMPWSIEQHALDAARLLQKLGIRKAHVIGYSTGAAVALELALDFPEVVGSVVLLELGLPSVAEKLSINPELAQAQGLYARGDKTAALDHFLSAYAGGLHRKIIDTALPAGSFELAVQDVDTIFLYELPALRVWDLSQNIAMRMSKSVLLGNGGETLPLFKASRKTLAEWIPDSEAFEIGGAGHALHMQAPDLVASAIASFIARHPALDSAEALV